MFIVIYYLSLCCYYLAIVILCFSLLLVLLFSRKKISENDLSWWVLTECLTLVSFTLSVACVLVVMELFTIPPVNPGPFGL
jgi:hypothetical protein